MLYQAKTKAKVEVVGTGKGCAAAKATAVAGGCALACSQHACRSCTHSPAHTPPVLTGPAQRMVRLHSHVSCMHSSCVVAPLTLLTLPACSPLLPLLLQFPKPLLMPTLRLLRLQPMDAKPLQRLMAKPAPPSLLSLLPLPRPALPHAAQVESQRQLQMRWPRLL